MKMRTVRTCLVLQKTVSTQFVHALWMFIVVLKGC